MDFSTAIRASSFSSAGRTTRTVNVINSCDHLIPAKQQQQQQQQRSCAVSAVLPTSHSTRFAVKAIAWVAGVSSLIYMEPVINCEDLAMADDRTELYNEGLAMAELADMNQGRVHADGSVFLTESRTGSVLLTEPIILYSRKAAATMSRKCPQWTVSELEMIVPDFTPAQRPNTLIPNRKGLHLAAAEGAAAKSRDTTCFSM